MIILTAQCFFFIDFIYLPLYYLLKMEDKKIQKLSYETIKGKRPDLTELKNFPRFPVSVVLENIRSLYNVGSMFRTSDGARIEKLYLCGYTGYPPRKEIDKTALGSVESVPWEHNTDTGTVINRLKGEGCTVLALEHTDRSLPYSEMDYSFPLCLCVGNEVDGLSHEVVSRCDGAVEIPMFGLKQSLNAAVAYGIVIYHMVMQYQENCL